jgi:Ca2+:H+ antiporter
MAVILGTMIADDGRSNWFKGVQLVAIYMLVAATLFFIPVQS